MNVVFGIYLTLGSGQSGYCKTENVCASFRALLGHSLSLRRGPLKCCLKMSLPAILKVYLSAPLLRAAIS